MPSGDERHLANHGHQTGFDFSSESSARLRSALGWMFAAVLVLTSALAFAQDSTPPVEKRKSDRFFRLRRPLVRAAICQRELVVQGRAGEGRRLQQEAGAAAKTTVEGAKDAAGAVARIPNVRTVSGHEKCQVAPNGAPDCVAAANAICKAKGFDSGRSLDMTTAEICPAKVWMAGRSTGPECRTETFVSRAVCQ